MFMMGMMELTWCLAAITLALASTAAGVQDWPEFQVVDLTYALGPDTLQWPTVRSFAFTSGVTGQSEAGWRSVAEEREMDVDSVASRLSNFSTGKYWYEAYEFCMAEHTGTHLDAPSHFSKGTWSVDRIPVQSLLVPLAVVDLRQQVGNQSDYLISPEDVQTWEKTHGRLPEGGVVMFWTGWGSRWTDRHSYFGSNTTHPEILHFPGLDPKTALWLVTEREISGVAIDTASVDYGQSRTFAVHRILYSTGVYGLENIATQNLSKVPARGALLLVAPLKIRGGSGSPVRILALITSTSRSLEAKESSAATQVLSRPIVAMAILLGLLARI